MSCRRYEKMLVLHLHAELPEMARQQVEGHLGQCSACRERLEEYQEIIQHAAQHELPAPSAGTVEMIRQAVRIGVTDSGRRAIGADRMPRWSGARVGVVAAVSSVVLLAAVALTVRVVLRTPSPPPYEPPTYVDGPRIAPQVDEEFLAGPFVLRDEHEEFTEPVRESSDLEDRLANLEANTFFIDQQMAREMMPVFDRRMRGLEDAVGVLALELERD